MQLLILPDGPPVSALTGCRSFMRENDEKNPLFPDAYCTSAVDSCVSNAFDGSEVALDAMPGADVRRADMGIDSVCVVARVSGL